MKSNYPTKLAFVEYINADTQVKRKISAMTATVQNLRFSRFNGDTKINRQTNTQAVGTWLYIYWYHMHSRIMMKNHKPYIINTKYIEIILTLLRYDDHIKATLDYPSEIRCCNDNAINGWQINNNLPLHTDYHPFNHCQSVFLFLQ